MSIHSTHPVFVRTFANFLHAIDANAIRFTHDDHYKNVRLPMAWPSQRRMDCINDEACGGLRPKTTQALVKQVFAIRALGYEQPIWIDFDARKLVVAFRSEADAMLFKLTHGGAQ